MNPDLLTHDPALPPAEHLHRRWPFRRSPTMRYGVAILAVIVAFAIRYLIYDDLQTRLVFAIFVPAAMVAVWYGGVGPGLLATVLGLLIADYFFIPPRYSFWPLDGPGVRGITVYTITTLLCVVLCENLHRCIRRLEQDLDRARQVHHHTSHPGANDASLLATFHADDAALSPGEDAHGDWPFQRPLAARYGLAVVVVILAFALRYWIFGPQDHRFPFIFFVPAAMIATWYGGMAPGLLATAAGLLLGDYFFLHEHEALGPVREAERLAIGLYAVTTALCVMLFENLHNRIRRLEHALKHALHPQHRPHPEAYAPPDAAATR